MKIWIAEKLRQIVKIIKIPNFENISFTVSIDISTYNKKDNLIEVIEKADKAMYLANKEGKDRVKVYSL